MFRASAIRPSPVQRAVGRNLSLDSIAAVGVGVTLAMVTALLPTIARRGGLEPLGLAALAAAPFVANLLGAFAGRWGPRTPTGLGLLRAAGAASLLVVFVLPAPPAMIAVAIVFWLSLSFGSPFHLRLWGAMYPAWIAAAWSASSAWAGRGDGAGCIRRRAHRRPAGRPERGLAVGGVVGLACALAYTGLRARTGEPPAPSPLGVHPDAA